MQQKPTLLRPLVRRVKHRPARSEKQFQINRGGPHAFTIDFGLGPEFASSEEVNEVREALTNLHAAS